LLVLRNETDVKIDAKNVELKEMKELQKKKKELDDEIPF
jgi:hypothetical protein